MTLSLANHDASLPIAYQLYLPEDWAKDQARRQKAKIPETIAFQTKPEIALEQIKVARTAGLPQGVVLMDAGYGNDTGLRTEITALGMSYVAGSVPIPRSGRRAQPHCRHRLDRGVGGHRSVFNAMGSTSRSGSRHSPSAYRKRRGKPSHGAREPLIGSRRALPGAECGRRIAITC